MYFYRVAVPIPYVELLTYKSKDQINIGSLVEVEVGKRIVNGIVFHSDNDLEDNDLKYIRAVLSDNAIFNSCYIDFLKVLSNYYCYPIGTVLYKLVPLKLFKSNICDKASQSIENIQFHLNEEQSEVYDKIKSKLGSFGVTLLYGVTGSGKTEVYCKLINDILAMDGQVLYIVPEIALTSQLFQRLKNRVSSEVAIYHSKISLKVKERIFNLFNQNRLKVVLGARSSLFLPPSNLKMIVVDEEHETSFKQDDIPHYQLRDMAVLYGKINNIPVILGSATPSMETMNNGINGKYEILRLTGRYHRGDRVSIKLVDMKEAENIGGIISQEIYDGIFERIKKNEQVLLLVNKKGYSRYLLCQKCSEILKCPNCDVALTYYKSENYAKCHYCSSIIRYFKCNRCGNNDFFPVGSGSEKVYEVIEELFSNEVLRLDQDVVTSMKRVDNILETFGKKDKKILVGTGIIAKGLDYPDITLIGVINIDNMFALPDFRSEERAFQILVQFAGRGGRFEKGCEMIIQTYNIDNPVFEYLIKGDYDKFYIDSLKKRKLLHYPPFCRLVRVLVDSANDTDAFNISNLIAEELKGSLQRDDILLGPSTANINKIKNRYRYNFLIKVNNSKNIQRYKKIIEQKFSNIKKGNASLSFDVDPYNFM
ncbi:MAG: primosomal protein N' [Calditerrivibrio sp.]|nr:primosomal protein N' [Calditerrivibrio sp.]MCA1932848.1 primosomal protein N' [Calditerrivibrio sp.]